MVVIKKLILFAFLLVASQACDFVAKDMQIIEIKAHEDDVINDEVVKSLMYYSGAYIAHNVHSITAENGHAIQPGWTPGDSVGDAKYRIFYVLTEDALNEDNVEQLKAEFAEFIPKLANDHVQKLPLFDSESKKMKIWIEGLDTRSVIDVYQDFSEEVRKSFTELQLKQIMWKIRDEYGELTDLSFKAGQYYRAYANLPEHIALVYFATFEDGKKSEVRLSITGIQPTQLTKIIGLNFSPPF